MFEAGQEKLMLYKLFPATGRFNEACSAYAGCEFKALCESQHIQRQEHSTQSGVQKRMTIPSPQVGTFNQTCSLVSVTMILK